MPLAVHIHAREMEMDDRLKKYVESRVSKLDHYLDILEEANVDLRHARSARSAEDRQVAQLTVRGKGVLLRAEERTADIYASVDAVLSKIQRQIDKYKGRRWSKRGDGRKMGEVLSELPEERTEEVELIALRKRFHLVPMSEAEAIEQMTLLGYDDFFIFYNGDTNEVNVLYRRRDGTLGLIESEVV
ncbi:MAG: ribosome hibernation-promoting factor, HPF/YfiA family [Anaerolineales bacterium]